MNTAAKITISVVSLLLVMTIYQQFSSQAKIAELRSLLAGTALQRAEFESQTLQSINDVSEQLAGLETRIIALESASMNVVNQEAQDSFIEFEQDVLTTSTTLDSLSTENSRPSEPLESESDVLLSTEFRANQLIERSSPENALRHLAGLTEENLSNYMDTVATNIARQEDEGVVPSRLRALVDSRDQLSDEFGEGQIAIIDSYIEIYEFQQNQATQLEQELLRQLQDQQ